MIRHAFCLLILFLAGCQTCQTPTYTRQPDSSEPWNTNYLIDAQPSAVPLTRLYEHAVELNDHYWAYSQVNGVLLPAWRTDTALEHPDRWLGGGDSGLYTGQALATFALQYGATKNAAVLQSVTESLRGLYILTHSTGEPGVIQRNAFPAHRPTEFGFPAEWQSRIARGYVGTGPELADPFGGPPIPPSTYYTRGTKDQLTGLILGLATVWRVMDPATVDGGHQQQAVQLRAVAKQIADAIYAHLVAHNWRIRARNSNTGEWDNDTGADYVDQLLRACVLGLVVHMGNTGLQQEYDEVFDEFIDLSNTLAYADRFANFSQYYAHNLRASRTLTLWLLEGAGSVKGQAIAGYYERNVWRFTRGHRSAWFAYVRAATAPTDTIATLEGLYSLRSLTLKPIRMWSSPYHGQEQKPNIVSSLICVNRYILDPHLRKPEDFSTWQKEPWDVGPERDWDREGLGDSSGIDYMLAYWLGRYYGIL